MLKKITAPIKNFFWSFNGRNHRIVILNNALSALNTFIKQCNNSGIRIPAEEVLNISEFSILCGELSWEFDKEVFDKKFDKIKENFGKYLVDHC